MKNLLFAVFMFIGFNVFSQIDCPPNVGEFTIFYSKPLVLNQIIDTLFVCDPDVDQSHVWTIDDPSGLWTLKTNTLYPNDVYISAIDENLVNLDDEMSYTFTVTVTDNGTDGTLSTSSIVNLIESNDPPVINENQVFAVDENLPAATIVGTVAASDINEHPLLYTIISGNDNNAFEINTNTGEIITTKPLNHEEIDIYYLTIQVEDIRSESTTGIITININDVNEAPVIYR